MKDTLDFVLEKFNVDDRQPMPIDIPDFNRFDLIAMLKELDFKRGVEIGVERGIFSEAILKANPQMHLTSIDPWVTYESGHIEHVDPEMVESFRKQTIERLSKYPNSTIMREGSIKGATKFKHGTLDFVYVDGDHGYEALINDLSMWTRRVRSGGIIAGHDYYNRPPDQYLRVGPAVRLFVKAFDINPWFTLGRAQTKPEFKRDSCRSFFWVKE
jgi:predicted O-methyltransferase YrrM